MSTPGPWDYFVGNANGRGLIRVEAAIDSPEAGKHVCSAPRGEESEANARLIAAAPDLLSALKFIADKCEDSALVGIAIDAIMKAEGR